MRIVIKLGTSSLTNGTQSIAPSFLIELAKQIVQLHNCGHQVVLVSSGAIAAGREKLNFPQLPKKLPAKQMLAAVGQPRLMALYEQVFGLYGLFVAQILLTRADLSNRRRYLNARNTLSALIFQKVVAIVNENDTVATEEIRVGDNDNLSALVASLINADILVLLTDQDGLFTSDPRIDSTAELIRVVSEFEIPTSLWQAAGGSKSGLGTGGMTTKLQAADLARRSGTTCVIANGNIPDVLVRLIQGEKIGTQFPALVDSVESRKRYIMSGRRAPGQLIIDEGAELALRRGSSLLSIGVIKVSGLFDRGDTICLYNDKGLEIARGISNYSNRDVMQIMHRRSDEIESVLGFTYGDEVVHRNDLVLL